ncbi:MAG: carbohydrate ABC transporter permease [Anaerolineaceae bacterium]|nr:carbohydrate ABC transporter permease [Anaerolineaceae bacterium]MCY3935976.1 carbohydrate ABC transporter permease [Chloroflexota bacterium]MCY4008295.1 carbohydrate ABC transporter permease [Anaerolineaceae bacterium]
MSSHTATSQPTAGIHWRNRFGWLSVRLGLGILCFLWLLPTVGLFIASIRTEEATKTTGWWKALTPLSEFVPVRSHTDAEQLDDGRYVIRGSLAEDEGVQGSELGETFGIRSNLAETFTVGETIDLGEYISSRAGLTLTINEDYTYEISSNEPIELSRGQNIFIEVTTPPSFTTEHYRKIIVADADSDFGIGRAFLNTFTVTVPATIIPISIAAFAAYAFSWMNFPFRNFLFIVVVALLVVPLQMALIPISRIYNTVGLKDTYPGIWLAHTGFGLPLAIYLLRNYIGGLPREIMESANIDGATHFQIFVRLVLPLSVPALASFAIFQFLWVWNDLLVARVFLGILPENQVLTAQMRSLLGTRYEFLHLLPAAAFISIFVPLIVFFSLQRFFVRGLLAGSVKGG